MTRLTLLVRGALPVLMISVLLVFGASSPLAATPTRITQGQPAQPALTVTVDDGANAVRPGEQLTYRATVTSATGSPDAQVLLEFTLPAYAKVIDAGGGTMRQTMVDFGLTVLSGANVSQTVTITVGSIPKGERDVTVLAAVFLIGGSSASVTPTIQARDIDAVASGPPGNRAAASSGAVTGAAGAGRTSGGSGDGNTALGIVLLFVGVIMIGVGLVLALRRSSSGRRRAGRGRPSGAKALPGQVLEPTPRLATTRHAQRPAGRPGSHSVR